MNSLKSLAGQDWEQTLIIRNKSSLSEGSLQDQIYKFLLLWDSQVLFGRCLSSRQAAVRAERGITSDKSTNPRKILPSWSKGKKAWKRNYNG